MAVSKKINTKKRKLAKAIFSILIILLGILLNQLNIGKNEYLGYSSLGTYLIFIGILMFLILLILNPLRKNKIIDERMEKIGYKASRITFFFIFLSAFIIMILDGIFNFSWSYTFFISYSICIILITYTIAYKIFEKYN